VRILRRVEQLSTRGRGCSVSRVGYPHEEGGMSAEQARTAALFTHEGYRYTPWPA
jgi:hypothetical protein